jgi:hypothetical protein
MFKKRRYESKPSVVKIMKQSGSTLNSHAYWNLLLTLYSLDQIENDLSDSGIIDKLDANSDKSSSLANSRQSKIRLTFSNLQLFLPSVMMWI